ncbi:serine/threonine protein kinase [Candidatus Vecturithrix granuli]|uniref:Serine/threonine protein kinase n=1 Tax=Vecturithrix granuli TaxID=1499967 RepID=A0A081C0F2_VECG1|nr:serine/threonine protein kinase [Candidatus Vecturithrix granuli]
MDQDRVYKRICTSLRIHAFRHNGYLSARDFRTLKLPATPEALEDVLLQLQAERKVSVYERDNGEMIYDFLPFLEESVEESVLDMATRFQLAQIYLYRKMWSHAITELRVTRTNPKFQKESLYLLGTCFEEKGAWEKAVEYYERVLASDYFYRDALERLAKLTEQKNQKTKISTAATVTSVQQTFHPRLQERYEIVRELGRGGAGIVYQAIDLKLKRDVALKVLYQQANRNPVDSEQYLREARLAAQLDHPNIIEIYDVDPEAQCIAMEFVNGGTLRDLLTHYKRLAVPQARTILLQLCRALQSAHEAGVLHRDIKPANIFITQKHIIKLGDFGIAFMNNLEQQAFTQLSVQIGTLPYMSPEQVRGEVLSAASDLYSVGIVLYEMLTGSPPFLQGDIAYHHLYSAPEAPGISPSIDAIVLRCLEKDPAKRFQTVKDLLQTLQAQEKDEQARLSKYRELLKIAIIDKELSPNEYLVLKIKRQALQLTEAEARKIEQELGLNLPW